MYFFFVYGLKQEKENTLTWNNLFLFTCMGLLVRLRKLLFMKNETNIIRCPTGLMQE